MPDTANWPINGKQKESLETLTRTGFFLAGSYISSKLHIIRKTFAVSLVYDGA